MNTRLQKNMWQWLPWLVLLLLLTGSLWAVTQRREAPQLITLGLLAILTFNFSLPLNRGAVGLVPMVAAATFLITGLETAVPLLLVSFLIAEFIYPLWQAAWNQERPSRWHRTITAIIFILSLITAAQTYTYFSGQLPVRVASLHLTPIISFGLSYGITYWLLITLYWLVTKQNLATRLREDTLPILAMGTLSQPFAILAAIILSSGLSGFIIFAFGVIVFSVIIWLSWQRRTTLAERLAQITRVNELAASLRETLNLEELLALTAVQLQSFMAADRVTIALINKDGSWLIYPPKAHADDFTKWVVENGRMLDIYAGNIHFAQRHHLTPPQPAPYAWLGMPLITSQGTLGAVVLQRESEPAFSRWQRELLVTVAAQISAAIQNARRFDEAERLYTLTDAALAERVQQLQALLDAMQDGVLMVDPNGRILLINPVAANMLAQPAYTLINTPLTRPEIFGFTQKEWQARIAQLQGQPLLPAPTTSRYTLQRQENLCHFTRQETAVLTKDGDLIGWLILFRDITQETELAERRTDLTRMIVHDLRNPLTTITSTIQLALRQMAASPEDAAALLAHARATTTDMLDMVDSLMDITRMETGNMIVDAEAMHLRPLVEQVLARLRPYAQQQQIALQLQAPPQLPPVWADEELVRRILVNLLDNALKFTPKNGQITVILQSAPPETNGETGIRCTVADSGPGIPPESRPYVFDRYMRTNIGGAQVRGTGLGLTFCKLAVEAQNGRIWVEDNPTGGSQFVFILPGIPHFNL
ncbi:MAG: hypothetical protein Kow0080_28320 [Candidatus Promineifilaceae bacterium]